MLEPVYTDDTFRPVMALLAMNGAPSAQIDEARVGIENAAVRYAAAQWRESRETPLQRASSHAAAEGQLGAALRSLGLPEARPDGRPVDAMPHGLRVGSLQAFANFSCGKEAGPLDGENALNEALEGIYRIKGWLAQARRREGAVTPKDRKQRHSGSRAVDRFILDLGAVWRTATGQPPKAWEKETRLAGSPFVEFLSLTIPPVLGDIVDCKPPALVQRWRRVQTKRNRT
jgi:hypothetical protein